MRTAAAAVVLLCTVMLLSCGTPPKSPDSDQARLPVRIVELPEATHLSRAHVGSYEESGENFGAFMEFIGAHGIIPQGDLMGVLLDDPSRTPHGQCRYEVRIPVLPGTQVPAPYEVKTVPPATTAAVVLLGDYPEIAKRYGEIYEWIDANGWEPAGPIMEIYLVHPGSGVPPDQYETEVHIPVLPAK